MATSKPDIMIILLSKLMEEGDMFYKVRRRRRLLHKATDSSLHIDFTRILVEWHCCQFCSLVLEPSGECHPSVEGS